jgi:hypothetical protein
MSSTDGQPIRQDSAAMFSGKRMQAGTLLLFPDRLVHVASNLAGVGLLGGALGAVLAAQAAKSRAVGRATQGGKGVLEIPFVDISGIGRGKQGLNRNILEIRLIDGSAFKFGVKFDRWAPELARALPAHLFAPQDAIPRI